MGDPRGDLAPRDVVARAIDFEMKKTGAEHVWLDITDKKPALVKERFPNIFEECLRWGFDITAQPIPVVPAAHFMCGGIVDLEGRYIPGLWVIGESAPARACTGPTGWRPTHRLRSSRGRRRPGDHARRAGRGPTYRSGVGAAVPSEAVVITHNWDELRRLMWNYVGIVRSDTRLRRAARRIDLLNEEIIAYYWKYFVTRDLLELRNIA